MAIHRLPSISERLTQRYCSQFKCDDILSLSDVKLGAAAERWAMEQCRMAGWGVAPSEPDDPYDFEVTNHAGRSMKVQSKATRWSPEKSDLVRFGLEKKAEHKRKRYSVDDADWFVFTLAFPHPVLAGGVLTSIWMKQQYVVGSTKASFLLDEPDRFSDVRRWWEISSYPTIFKAT